MHSTFLRVTGLLLINNEIGQSILRTYTALWRSFAPAQFRYSCATLIAIVRESSKRLARLHEICMWLNGYFTSSAAAVLLVVRRPSSASAVVIHHPPSPPAARLNSPPRPPPSESFAAIVVHPAAVVCHIRVLYLDS